MEMSHVKVYVLIAHSLPGRQNNKIQLRKLTERNKGITILNVEITPHSSFYFLEVDIIARLCFFILYSFPLMHVLSIIMFSMLVHPALHFLKSSPHSFRGFVNRYNEIEYELESHVKQKKVKKNS